MLTEERGAAGWGVSHAAARTNAHEPPQGRARPNRPTPRNRAVSASSPPSRSTLSLTIRGLCYRCQILSAGYCYRCHCRIYTPPREMRTQVRAAYGEAMMPRILPVRLFLGASMLALAAVSDPVFAADAPSRDGLLFRASADKGLIADRAQGDAAPNFQTNVAIVPDRQIGGAIQWEDDGAVAWQRTRQHLCPARHALLLLAAALSGRRGAFRDVPRRLRRSFELGHGVPAHRLERPRLRRLRYRCQPGTRAAYRCRIARAPGSRPMESYRLRLGRRRSACDSVRRRQGGRTQGRQGRSQFAGLDQFGLAGRIISPHQVQSRYQLHARQRCRRDPRL